MFDTIEVVLLTFLDYATGERVPVVCHEWDLTKGYITLTLLDRDRKRYYSIGKRFLQECVEVSCFRTFESLHTGGMIKWKERDKLYEKYPKLKNVEVHYGDVNV